MSWYTDGTVTVTNGSKSVVGNGTLWASQASSGDLFSLDADKFCEIDAVVDDTHITLKNVYAGATAAGKTYAIIRNFTSTLPAQLASKLATLMADYHMTLDELVAWLAGSGYVTIHDPAGIAYQVKSAGQLTAESAGLLLKSVAGNADVVLTDVQASNAFLKFTGTLTGNISVIVPAAPRKWVVQNATTGAYTVTVKTAAGAGRVIRQGNLEAVWCDGTNVLRTDSDGAKADLAGADFTGPISATAVKAGSVGIGVTPSPWAGLIPLQIGKRGYMYGDGGASETGIGVNAYYSGGWKYMETSPASRLIFDNGGSIPFTFQYAPSGTAGDPIAWKTAMTLDANGNCGLGVTPSSRLTVSGIGSGLPSSSGSASEAAIRIQNGGNTPILDIGVDTDGTNASWIQARRSSDYSQNYNLFLQPNGGNLSIGNTAGTHKLRLGSADSALTYATSSSSSAEPPAMVLLNNTPAVANSSSLIAFRVNAAAAGGYAGFTSPSAGVQTDASFVIGRRTSTTAYAESFRLDPSGNMLAGVTGGTCHVLSKGSSEGTQVLSIGSSAAFYVGGSFAWNAGASCYNVAKNTTTARSINTAGTINASGSDYAEYMIKADGCGLIAKGQIVGADTNGRLTDKWSESISFLIKSTNPSYVGGDTWGNDDALGMSRPVEPQFTPPEYTGSAAPGDAPVEPDSLPEDATDEQKAAYAAAEDAYRTVFAAWDSARATYELDQSAYAASVATAQQIFDTATYSTYQQQLATFEAALEAARQKVDRIAYTGQVPVNVTGAVPGQYIVPAEGPNDTIIGVLVDDASITFEQYRRAVGIVQNILPDGRANVRVKVA